MHAKTRPNRALSLFLILAMLVTLFAALLPVAVSAGDPEPEEIQDFGYQSSADFAIGGVSTDLRFLFTIGSLDYDEVGFVFSFENYGNNTTPTVGGSGCYKVSVDTVYRSVIADGEPNDAPAGRWWVAAKLTNIPFASYYEWIYVRAFVTDGSGTRYSAAKKLSALKANRGSGEEIHEAVGTSSTGSGSVIEYKRNIYTDVLNSGAKHFYPDASNNFEGNDLLIEYSVFFNQYLVNYLKHDNGPCVTSRIANENYSSDSAFSWWSPCANCKDSDCAYAGGFDVILTLNTPVSDAEVTTPVGMTSAGGGYADYPNIGGSDPENPEYGWHRIGIRIHEEVTTPPTAQSGAGYLFTVTTYIDGTAAFKMQGVLSKPENYLYTATYNAGTGEVEYNDIGAGKYVFIYRMKYQGNSTGKDNSAYCVFADADATCGKEFSQTVEHVIPVEEDPNDGGYRADNEKGISGPRYYRIVRENETFPGSISVMSYNIEGYGHGGDGWDGRDPSKAIQTVRDVSPDVVGFQEADTYWSSYFSALTSNGYSRLQGDSTTDKGEWVDIFYKTAKFTKISEGTYKYKSVASSLSVPNTESADQSKDTHGRIFHYAVLQETASGKKILVVNTHLHYGGTGSGHEEDDKVRRYEIRTLLAWLETQRATYPNQIVMGDMNSHYKSGQGKVNMALYTDAGFVKTSSAAGVRYDVGGTLANSRTTRPEWIFDYILTRGNIDTAYYTAIPNKIDNGGTTYPSDHIPILAKIYLR